MPDAPKMYKKKGFRENYQKSDKLLVLIPVSISQEIHLLISTNSNNYYFSPLPTIN